MFFSTIISFAIFLATAAANLHKSCTCLKDGSYNAYITSAACGLYTSKFYKWGSTVYNSDTGRCTAPAGSSIAGNQWESACQDIARQTGFPCPDGKGTCRASVGIRGSC